MCTSAYAHICARPCAYLCMAMRVDMCTYAPYVGMRFFAQICTKMFLVQPRLCINYAQVCSLSTQASVSIHRKLGIRTVSVVSIPRCGLSACMVGSTHSAPIQNLILSLLGRITCFLRGCVAVIGSRAFRSHSHSILGSVCFGE